MPHPLWFGTSGPQDAAIMAVGEAWGAEEMGQQIPLVGQSGQEFTRILAAAGIDRRFVFLTNVISKRPFNNEMWREFHPKPKSGVAAGVFRGLHPTQDTLDELTRLYQQIAEVEPQLILSLGNYPLWALTTAASTTEIAKDRGASTGIHVPSGIGDYRGSMLFYEPIFDPGTNPRGPPRIPVLPLYHPASILRQWKNRAVTIHDIKFRAKRALSEQWERPATHLFKINFTANEICTRLAFALRDMDNGRHVRINVDIETHARRFITCIGLAFDDDIAWSIPLVRILSGTGNDRTFGRYWSADDEFKILRLVRKVLKHANARVEGQGFLYDTQHLQVELGIHPTFDFDSMLGHHMLFPGTKQDLGYISSIYCHHHVYWKDDNRDWASTGTLEQHLTYNAMDARAQFEASTVIRGVFANDAALTERFEFEKYRQRLCLRMMNRGVRIDNRARHSMLMELVELTSDVIEYLNRVAPQHLIKSDAKTPWYRSAQQTMYLFYDMLKLTKIMHRKTKQPTFGKEALKTLRQTYPGLRPLLDRLAALRSFTNLQRNFLSAAIDPDVRMRCSFHLRPVSFRLGSSKNAFGRGTNLQNIPKGKLTDLELDIVDTLPDEDEDDESGAQAPISSLY